MEKEDGKKRREEEDRKKEKIERGGRRKIKEEGRAEEERKERMEGKKRETERGKTSPKFLKRIQGLFTLLSSKFYDVFLDGDQPPLLEYWYTRCLMTCRNGCSHLRYWRVKKNLHTTNMGK